MVKSRTLGSRLRHRIRIESYTATRDSYGEEVKSWATVATVYAGIMPLSGREYVEAQATQDETTVRFLVRWQSAFERSGLDADMRIVDPNTNYIYDIKSINHKYHARREIELVTTQTNEVATVDALIRIDSSGNIRVDSSGNIRVTV